MIAISIERAGAVETLTRAEAARESEKLRSALLDSVTHEFRTPLTAIKLSVTTLLSPDPIDPDSQQGTAHGHQRRNRSAEPAGGRSGGDGAARRAASGTAPRVAQPSARSIEAALEKSKQALAGREVKLQLPESLPPIRVDLERIAEVLVQLLENAAKYSPAASPITITAERAGKMVSISVADQGPGIDDHGAVADLREVLSRARPALSRARHGHGIWRLPKRLSKPTAEPSA